MTDALEIDASPYPEVDDATEVQMLADVFNRCIHHYLTHRGGAQRPVAVSSAVIGAAYTLSIIKCGQLGDPLLPQIIIAQLGGNPFGKPH